MSETKYYPLCSVEDLPPGERMYVTIDDNQIVVIHHGGKYYAIADLCTHDQGPLGDGEIEDDAIICPRHGARFDLRTGDVLSLPAVKGVPVYPVQIENGMVAIGIKE